MTVRVLIAVTPIQNARCRSRSQDGTVLRLLQRLEDTGFLDRDGSLIVRLFSAAISRQAYSGSQLERLAGRLTCGS